MKISEFCEVLDNKLSLAEGEEKLETAAFFLQQAFKVSDNEVALLKLSEQETLHFIWPEKLSKSGSIPLVSRESFAANTVRENKARLHNRFTSKHHASIFEKINLTTSTEADKKNSKRPMTIQKIMSAPLVQEDEAVGVIQVSRKADDIEAAGPDFTKVELAALSQIARVIGKHL
jgi:primosomal protein N'